MNDPQVVPHMSSWNSGSICNEVAKATPANVDYANCQLMAAHIYGASGGTDAGVIYQNRVTDIHDTCVRLLVRAFPTSSEKRWIAPGDFDNCSLKRSGGVTGVRCLFLHGMGAERLTYKGDAHRDGAYLSENTNDGWLGSWPKYWLAESALDGLCDVRYYVTETTARAWTDDATQKEYCAAVDRFNPQVVFTHSMGNNIVAAAITRNIAGACQRINVSQDKDSITWFSSQAPWIGSPAATASREACEKNAPQGKGLSGLFNRIKNAVVRAVKPCGKEAAALSLDPTVAVPHSAPTFVELRATALKHTSGSLCGVSAAPLTVRAAFSFSGLGLYLLQSTGAALGLVKWGADAHTRLPPATPISGNDGLVPFGSCGLPERVYTSSPLNPYYTAEVSHQDGTCYIGSDISSLGASKQPCSWYVLRVSESRKRLMGVPSLSTNVHPVGRTSSYLPFASFSYPQSFLEVQGWQTREEVQAKEAAEAAAALKEAEENGDRSALEAFSTTGTVQLSQEQIPVVPGPAEIALEAALAEVYGQSLAEMQAALKADAEASEEEVFAAHVETDAEAQAQASAVSQSAVELVEQLEAEVAELEEEMQSSASDPAADEERND